MEKFFKIVIPAYNVADKIERCLNSVFSQTFSDFFVLVVDDMSIDNTIDVCNNFKKLHSDRFDVVKLKEKLFQGGARNFGVFQHKTVVGKYVWFLDADDYLIDNDALKKITKAAEKNPDLINIAWKTKKNVVKKPPTIDELFSYDYYSAPWMRVLKQSIVERFPEKLNMAEDKIQKFMQLDAIDQKKIASISDPLYYYNAPAPFTEEKKLRIDYKHGVDFLVNALNNRQFKNLKAKTLCEKLLKTMEQKYFRNSFFPNTAICLKRKNKEAYKNSSTCGFVSAIAKKILNNGGVAYGAAYSKDFKSVEHIRVDTYAEFEKRVSGSKYVTSTLNRTYLQVKSDLEHGKTVLFVGTPCQAFYLRKFLNKDVDCAKLIIVSLFCNSTPKQKEFQKYVESMERKHGANVTSLKMRSRKNGSWEKWGLEISFSNGKEYFGHYTKDPFISDFLKHKNVEEKCKHCKMRYPYNADIVVGDCWNAKYENKGFYDSNGVEVCLFPTQRGADLAFSVAGEFVYKKINFDSAKKKHNGLRARRAKIVTYLLDQINYGQKLQAYAMQQLCKKNGIYPETYCIKELQYDKELVKSKLDRFQRLHMNLIHRKPNSNDNADFFILGSDQVLHPRWTNDIFLLNTIAKDTTKIAIAPSISDDCVIPKEKREKFKKSLSQFKTILMRERKGVAELQRLGISSKFVLDPVFLIKDDLEKLAEKPRWLNLKEGAFSFSYVLRDFNRDAFPKCNIDVLDPNNKIGIENFLWLVLNCKEFYTDSFHCSVLGVLFNRKFKIVMNDYMKKARFDVFGEIGFSNSMEENWPSINAKLKELQEESLKLIKKAMEDDNV